MSLTKKFNNFLADNNVTLTDDEKSSLVEYLEAGVMPPSDDDLGINYTQMALNEGYNFRINKFNSLVAAKCPNCGTSGSMFSKNPLRKSIQAINSDRYLKNKCFKCGLGRMCYTNEIALYPDGRIAIFFVNLDGKPDSRSTVRGRT